MDEIKKLIQNSSALILYFSHEGCNVCKVLKPKIKELLKEKFSKIQFHEIDTVNLPEISAQLSVFTVPTILVYFNGSEFFRLSRHFNMKELTDSLERPYKMLFE